MNTDEIKSMIDLLNRGETETVIKQLEQYLPQPVPFSKKLEGIAQKTMQEFHGLIGNSEVPWLSHPVKCTYGGTDYTAFCCSYAVVLTNRSCPECLDQIDINNCEDAKKYIPKLPDVPGRKADLMLSLAVMKETGYRFYPNIRNKKQSDFLFRYGKTHYMAFLVELAMRILNDGHPVTLWPADSWHNRYDTPLFLETSAGYAMIMPFRYSNMSHKMFYIRSLIQDRMAAAKKKELNQKYKYTDSI